MRTLLPILALVACGTPDDDSEPSVCDAGDTQVSDIACGLNDRGLVEQECVDGAWQDGTCDDPDDCVDGDTDSEACWDGAGTLSLGCEEGEMVEVQACRVDAPILVSMHTDGTLGDDRSDDPVISADGRWVAFISYATNLVDGDTNARRDVFLHDLETRTTTLVSQATDGTIGTGDSWSPSISADGRYVAFVTQSNFDAGDIGTTDVYLRDTVNGTTSWISKNAAGEGGDRDDFWVDISADGSVVAFSSNSTNLVAGDDNLTTDMFFWEDGQPLERFAMANGAYASNPVISGDGSYVAFISDAASAVARGGGPEEDAYLLDRGTGSAVLMSRDANGTDSISYSLPDDISDDGKLVVFWTRSPLTADDGNTSDDVYLYDRLADDNEVVSLDVDGDQTVRSANYPRLSAAGDMLVFQSNGQYTDVVTGGPTHIYLRDLATGAVSIVSVDDSGTPADTGAVKATLSADARHVGFVSSASNLDTASTVGTRHVFVVPGR
ncbi:MAG: PD40 domain-containing protein [Proteobacteria bacterium]|nr:PD40 domain-containing protein [Pseudomonadota bacterium]